MKRKAVRGRRPGEQATRAAIVRAARSGFVTNGYRGASVRSIALAAAVDPALIYHYFGSKRELYATAVELPPNTGDLLRATLDGEARAGERFVTTFLEAWDAPAGMSAFAGLLRSAADDPGAQATLGDLIAQSLIGPAVAAVDAKRSMSKLRAALVAAQLLGLAWMRYVLPVEPVASASAQIVGKTFGPSIAATLQGVDYGG